MKALIVSDGKPGHFNQSIALCKNIGIEYEIVEVKYPHKINKALSYLFDRVGIYTKKLLTDFAEPTGTFDFVVSTGSTTYYANKILAKKLKIPNVAIMYPKSYRLDFSHIFCPAYDNPPKKKNITELPLNLCASNEDFFAEKTKEFSAKHQQDKSAVGIVIGGPNAVSEIDADKLKEQLDQIFELTEGKERWVTTSRRTPAEVEKIIDSLPFDYKLINSRDSYNPIPAFIQNCERLFVTSDSASMISECASFGTAFVEILKNKQLKTPNKFEALIDGLVQKNAVHLFDGNLGDAKTKIEISDILREPIESLSDC